MTGRLLKYGIKKNFMVTVLIFSLVSFSLLFTPSSIGKGIIPTGGVIKVGLSARVISNSPSRPLTPLNSILLDEIYESAIPENEGSPIAKIEKIDESKARMIIKPNIVVGDMPSRTLTADDVALCLQIRAHERWDARWALRGLAEKIEGTGYPAFSVTDESTIEFGLKPGADFDKIKNSFESPALRLSISSGGGVVDGTGPFNFYKDINDSNMLGRSLAYHAGRPFLDRVDVISYLSADESVLDFGRGSLDALLITSDERQKYAESSRAAHSRLERVGDALLVLLVNPARLPSLEERRSLVLASDRKGIAEVVLGEGAQAAGDFFGTFWEASDFSRDLEEARKLHTQAKNAREKLTLLVCDDPAARAASGRLRANWESLGVPVEIRESEGPLSLSISADAILLAFRLPKNGDGVFPELFELYDRNGWWSIAGLVLDGESASILKNVRSLGLNCDLNKLGRGMESSGLAIPLAKYGVLFAPGPGVSLVSGEIYPGSVFWRAFNGIIPVNREMPE
ncbi:MAG: ABC transporter substrate-binding protein [bacterium]